jgi:hypothetical protein
MKVVYTASARQDLEHIADWLALHYPALAPAVERHIRAVVREITIADGLIFPMVSALSLFVRKKNGHWTLAKPDVFKDEDLIEAAVEQFREGCNSDPVVMGRSAGAYQSLMLVPRMSLRFQATQ